jgi:hypothetical protein
MVGKVCFGFEFDGEIWRLATCRTQTRDAPLDDLNRPFTRVCHLEF